MSKMLKYCLLISVIVCALFSCNNKPAPTVTSDEPPKGEFAFLLQYDGKMPADVGFLTNHVVERRLANIMKDSFMIFMSKTKYARPIIVHKNEQLVAALFCSDSNRTDLCAMVLIDVKHDAVWANYSYSSGQIHIMPVQVNGHSVLVTDENDDEPMIEFTDHLSMQRPSFDMD